MWNLIKLLFGIVIIISVISMFQISWEIGLSVFVLITAAFCIWIVLKKITKVVFYPDLVLSSEPFRNSITTRIPSLFDSSLMSLMPSIFLSLTN